MMSVLKCKAVRYKAIIPFLLPLLIGCFCSNLSGEIQAYLQNCLEQLELVFCYLLLDTEFLKFCNRHGSSYADFLNLKRYSCRGLYISEKSICSPFDFLLCHSGQEPTPEDSREPMQLLRSFDLTRRTRSFYKQIRRR